MIELRHLRYFVAVAEELHFGRAASRLGISQPPLSQQLRALEEELGAPLLERTSRRVRLTDAGRLLLAEARATLAQADHAVDVVRRVRRGEAGELAIGFAASAPFVTKVSNALFRYRRAYPDVHLRLAELPRDEQLALVASRELDIGFVRGVEKPRLAAPLIAVQFMEEELLVAMRSDHRLAAADGPLRVGELAEVPMVLYQRRLGAGFNEDFDLLCRNAGFEPLVAQEVAGLATLLGLVAAGFGLTVLVRSMSALQLGDLVYRRLDEPEAISRLWLVHRQEPSATCARFLALACDGAPGSDTSPTG